MFAAMMTPVGYLTRDQMIDEAVRRVDVPAYWREYYANGIDRHHATSPVAIEDCLTCQMHFRMVREQFARVALGLPERRRR